MWTGLYLYQSQIPVAKALCECTFTVSDSYFYDSDDYFGPSPKDHRVGVLSNFLWNVSHIIKLLRVVASWHLLQDEDNYVWVLAIYPQGIHFTRRWLSCLRYGGRQLWIINLLLRMKTYELRKNRDFVWKIYSYHSDIVNGACCFLYIVKVFFWNRIYLWYILFVELLINFYFALNTGE